MSCDHSDYTCNCKSEIEKMFYIGDNLERVNVGDRYWVVAVNRQSKVITLKRSYGGDFPL
jgi:hypothetical protein